MVLRVARNLHLSYNHYLCIECRLFMNKRITAFLFTSLAYLVIMVHAVIPHHHHDETICIPFSFLGGTAHGNHDCSADHSHKGDCALASLTLRPSQDNRPEESQPEPASYNDFFIHNTTWPVLPHQGINSQPGVLPPLIPASYISAANILRGPPLC